MFTESSTNSHFSVKPTYYSPPGALALLDSYQRSITYLRLSVTDLCNLRCRYCMPPGGIELQQRSEILSWEEMLRLVNIFVALGIRKLRITGGEPFVRKGLPDFLRLVRKSFKLGLYITTNGVDVARFVPELKAINISGINLSLDTLNRQRFIEIARRDAFEQVLETLNAILQSGIPLKINSVVKQGFNTDDILQIARLAQHNPVEIRFIEEMPFAGSAGVGPSSWNAERITALLRSHYPAMQALAQGNATARLFRIPGYVGRVGVIASYSRQFCGDCNRVRITANGYLKTCLYDAGALDLKMLLRSGASDQEIQTRIRQCVAGRFRDGFEAFANRRTKITESMASIGG